VRPPIDNRLGDHERIVVAPISSAMGAEVTGCDLAALDDDTFAEIERALYHHGLLVFRDQHLSHGDHDALTRRFGEHGVDAYTDGVPGFRDIQPNSREAGEYRGIFFGANWHTDSPFLDRPPSISMLRSVDVPPYGGDTLYTSTRQGYESLSDGMKALIGDLNGLYSRSHLVRARTQWEEDPSRPFDLAPVEHDLREAVVHPLVRTHPVTGLRSLYVDENYILGIEGLTRGEAAPLLRFLVEHTTRPEFHCRIRWTPDMLAMWDNRLVLHQAFDDYGPFRRETYRSTVLGEIPR
jgi:taurine dioxygenase